MNRLKYLSSLVTIIALLFNLGCASTKTQSSTGEYVDDTVIKSKNCHI